jgi:radical SAM protein with 4Fe4S-binding SPASM domain
MTSGKWVVGWGYTARCNMGCGFCYSKASRRGLLDGIGAPEVSLRIAKGFLARNRDLIRSINFGTGESFLAPEFASLLRACRTLIPALQISVTTNGAFAKASTCGRNMSAFKWGIDELDVSLDYADSKKHDRSRRHDGAWRDAIHSLWLAQDNQIRPSIVMVGTDDTMAPANFAEMLSIARCNECLLRINLYRPVNSDFGPVPHYATIRKALEYAVTHESLVQTSDPLFAALTGQVLAPQCSGNVCRILPNGRVTPSTYLLSQEWWATQDVTTLTLSSLAKEIPFLVLRDACVPTQCCGCSLMEVCRGGCADRRWLWYGSLEERDPYCPRRIGTKCQTWWKVEAAPRAGTPIRQIHLAYLPTIVVSPQCTKIAEVRCVKLLLIRGNKVLLLRRRSTDPISGGEWDLPGGTVDDHERSREALEREVREELGSSVRIRLSGEVLRWTASPKGGGQIRGQTFVGWYLSGRVTLSAEHSNLRWVTEYELRELLAQGSGISPANREAYVRAMKHHCVSCRKQ